MALYAMTVVPAYGRDYKTAKAAKEAWNNGNDFRCASYNADGYTSKFDWQGKNVMIRFNRLTQTVIVKG